MVCHMLCAWTCAAELLWLGLRDLPIFQCCILLCVPTLPVKVSVC